MIGRSVRQDTPAPPLDARSRFGAELPYAVAVSRPWSLTPWHKAPGWTTLHASNKDSEHNIGNTLPRIVVAQLAGQTPPPDLKRRISNRVILRPGSQSLGGT